MYSARSLIQEEEAEKFYEDVQIALNIEKDNVKIVDGDFNCKIDRKLNI